MDYLYDRTFDGLLTCIYHSYYEDKAEGIYPQDYYQYSLVNPSRAIVTNHTHSSRVYEAIAQKISSQALKQAYYVFLSNHPNKENLILKYLQLGFKIGSKVESYHTHPDVLPVYQTARKVSFEAHRFYGLLRFAESKDFLYASFKPDHNILIILAEHFVDRLARENFIIHDQKRNCALVYDKQEWYLTDFKASDNISLSQTEAFYQELWTRYFTHIGIESRRNKRLQSQFVPQRYRNNLIEFKNSLLSDLV